MMSEPFNITYSYRFDDDLEKSFVIALNKEDLSFVPKGSFQPPPWAELGHHRCENCTLDAVNNKYCPIAINMAEITDGFKEYFSHENVRVTVTTEDRIYSKNTDIQEGLGALIGIVMVTSGCPVMETMKPMVRFHLPFATLTESVYRMVSMYLTAQHFRHNEGKATDWNLERLEGIYTDVGIVNRDFAERLRDAAKKDANINALVKLDCFASMAVMSLKDILDELRPYFSAYLK